jgi:uncharacterized protein YciI
MPLFARTILVTGPPEEVAPAAERHREHLRDLKNRGKLRFAGELKRGDGFIELLETADRMEAEAIARSSPLVEGGLATWMLRECVELDLGP